MELKKIVPGKKVVIKISREDTNAEFNTNVVEMIGNCIVCKPIMHESKLVNFNIPGIKTEIHIFDETEGKLYAWKQVEIKGGYYKKTTICHLIYLLSPAVEVNRRETYRQYVGINGFAEPFHRPKVEVIIRDVSNTGIGILAEEKGNFEVGRHVTVTFNDEGGRFRFILECKIVRERKTEQGAYEIGCIVIDPPALFGQYVAYKQLATRRKALGLDILH